MCYANDYRKVSGYKVIRQWLIVVLVLCFPSYRSYAYFVRFILKCFIFGGANINNIVFLISKFHLSTVNSGQT